jgi:iron complex transport system substrate-binding protein
MTPDSQRALPERRSVGRRTAVVVLVAAIVAIFACSAWLQTRVAPPSVEQATGPCRRIISLAPSVTEVLFELGLDDRVVGVSRFCKYPPKVERLPRVGGLFDPNMEAIYALRPDLVIVVGSTDEPPAEFVKLGLPTLTVDHRDPERILTSITTIGRACGAERAADELVGQLRRRLERLRQKTANLPPVRVMLAVDHGVEAGRIEDVYVAGNSPYFTPVLRWAGGRNVFETVTDFPVVSREAILQADPEVIVDLVRVEQSSPREIDECLAKWRELEHVRAAATGRVYALPNEYGVPGPRFILLVEELARLLHPEVAWDG